MTDAEFVNADRLVAAEIGAHATTEAQAKQGRALADERRAALMAERQSLVTRSSSRFSDWNVRETSHDPGSDITAKKSRACGARSNHR